MFTVLFRTLLIYILLVGAMRFMGKRQIGELEISDLVTTLLLSEIATMPIENRDIPFIYAVIPIVTLLFFEVTESLLLSRSAKLKHLLTSRPSVLIDKGKIDQKELKRNRISFEELASELRLKDIRTVDDVYYAILEKNGKISVFKKATTDAVSPGDLHISVTETGIAHTLVSGGVPNPHGMNAAGMNLAQVRQILSDCGVQMGEVFCLSRDDGGHITLITKDGEAGA